MDADEQFMGPHHNFLKKIGQSKYNVENSESCLKCNPDEVNQLLSIRRILLEQPRYERCVSLAEAEWDDNLKLAKVTKVTKNLTKNFSHSRNKSIYLYPEECLCLLEMKCLILKWNEKKMSIKNAYALLLATGNGCTFNQFRTYGYLVKLGFRVFKHDSELKNDSYDPKDLTNMPDSKKKKSYVNNTKINNKTEISYVNKNTVPFPKLESSGWVVISRQPQMYLPHNLQPNYDVYSFNITIKSNTTEITEVISFYETIDFKKKPFHPKESIVYDSQQHTGMYPVYEKNIPNDRENIYEPRVKRLKQSKIDEESYPIIIGMAAASVSDDKSNIEVTNSQTNVIYKECNDIVNRVKNYKDWENYNLPLINSMKTDTFNADTSVHSSNEINLTEKVYDDYNYEEKMVIDEDNISINEASSNDGTNSINKIDNSLGIEENISDSIPNVNSNTINIDCATTREYKSTKSNIISEDTAQLNLPDRIRQKLFAIKPTDVHYSTERIGNEYTINYDVYYPDNEVPKTSRPAPNFRIIVFEDDLHSFPNVYNINIFNPNDNIPTLWAIVNSSSVSFYNVNNIILPKSTDWDLNMKNNQK